MQIDKEKARQGQTGLNMRYVLALSTLLAAACLLGLFAFWA